MKWAKTRTIEQINKYKKDKNKPFKKGELLFKTDYWEVCKPTSSYRKDIYKRHLVAWCSKGERNLKAHYDFLDNVVPWAETKKLDCHITNLPTAQTVPDIHHIHLIQYTKYQPKELN